MAQETTEELEDKLSMYKDNFYQMERALKEDPNNEAYLKVKEDLWEVIKLTEDLLKLRRKPTIEAKEVPPTPQEKEKQLERSSVDVLKAGSKCLALFAGDGKWYPAIIDSIN